MQYPGCPSTPPLPQVCKDKDALVRLWLHETCRVFHDRLINAEDKDYFKRMLHELAGRHGLGGASYEDLFVGRTILFGDFIKVWKCGTLFWRSLPEACLLQGADSKAGASGGGSLVGGVGSDPVVQTAGSVGEVEGGKVWNRENGEYSEARISQGSRLKGEGRYTYICVYICVYIFVDGWDSWMKLGCICHCLMLVATAGSDGERHSLSGGCVAGM
eukprot:322101-Chlamydomonas_euryale.AAC.1